jgi:NADPH:quinone reductase-like Zn-dependent oxidoreductase
VDVVYDSVGQTLFLKSLNCLRARGMLALFGQSSGAVSPLRSGTARREWLAVLDAAEPGAVLPQRGKAALGARSDVLNWVQSGSLKIRIDKVYQLAESRTGSPRFVRPESLRKTSAASVVIRHDAPHSAHLHFGLPGRAAYRLDLAYYL